MDVWSKKSSAWVFAKCILVVHLLLQCIVGYNGYSITSNVVLDTTTNAIPSNTALFKSIGTILNSEK